MTDAANNTEVFLLPYIYPGEILREEFLIPMGLTAYTIAKACHIPRTRIERIIAEKNGITGDTAFRLGKFFGTTPDFWMNLQKTYELDKALYDLRDEIKNIQPYQQNIQS